MNYKFQLILFSFLLSWTINSQDIFAPDAEPTDILRASSKNDRERIKEVAKYIEQKLKEQRGKPELIRETTVSNRMRCQHCPSHILLTESINGILQKLKSDPNLGGTDEVPVSINRLNFLFYTEKVRHHNIDGQVVCNRFLDDTKNFRPTEFPGTMELVMDDVFKFDGISQLQILDPSKEEIAYYYRGEGAERNIIVQAILTKDGGRLRYYYYRPTERELNPYNLPTLGESELRDVTIKKVPTTKPIMELKPTAEDLEERRLQKLTTSKDKANITLDPKLIMRNKYIPRNIQIAHASISQELMTSGFTVNGLSELSVRGNKAQLNLQDANGNNFIVLDVNTSLNGKTKRTIVVPYEMSMSTSKEGLTIKGQVEDSNMHSSTMFSLTDTTGQYFRGEVRKDKQTGVTVFGVAKDFVINAKEALAVAVGQNETRAHYAALQHKKAISENVTVVLDARVDSNKIVTLMYQLRANF